ncbi:MAG: shikimate dehydrogenase [Candidatus Hydrogenedentes bacterium]|nr:shikimate dehydrogenase [Candidatus Hydrogenedentota bacterium]
MTEINVETRLCAVIGNPVGHSLSPAMHNAAYRAAGINAVYVAFQVTDVRACLAGMRALPGFRGMSVTIPHKVAVLEHLDEVDDLAVQVGCANTITNEDGRLRGSITDGTGTLRAFAEAGIPLSGKRILFLGGGGAVRAVAFAMATQAQAAAITILGRNPGKIEPLAEDLRKHASAPVATGRLVEDIAGAMADHDVIVQGTPMGMYPHNEGESPVPQGLWEPRHVAFDMVYRPLKPRFLHEAESAGCRTLPGLEMLVKQAELQMEIWFGVPAPAGVMRTALLGALGSPTA